MATEFLYTLSGGMMLVLGTGPAAQISWRFLRTAAAVALGVVAIPIVYRLVTHTAGGSEYARYSFGLGMFAGLGAMSLTALAPALTEAKNLFRLICTAGGACGIAAGVFAALSLAKLESPATSVPALIVCGQILGALLLGSITVAWLLGHAYLTATKMTIAPLRHYSRMLLLSVALRAAFLLAVVVIVLLSDAATRTAAIAQVENLWMILLLRVGLGLVAVGAFAYMVADCVKLRSTQSATGILYFGSLFAYMGELANGYLISNYGWGV